MGTSRKSRSPIPTVPWTEVLPRFKARMIPPDPWDEAEFRRRDHAVWDLRVATLGAEAAATTQSGRREALPGRNLLGGHSFASTECCGAGEYAL